MSFWHSAVGFIGEVGSAAKWCQISLFRIPIISYIDIICFDHIYAPPSHYYLIPSYTLGTPLLLLTKSPSYLHVFKKKKNNPLSLIKVAHMNMGVRLLLKKNDCPSAALNCHSSSASDGSHEPLPYPQ